MFATPYMRINYTAGHNDFFVIGRDGIYRRTIKVRWKCRHSSAFKKGCWIQGNKISKCLVTLCIPRSLPGSVGAREGKCLLPNRLWESRCLGHPTSAPWEKLPPSSEKGDFKTSGAHCSAPCNDTTESPQVHGMDTSLHLPLSTGKAALSLLQVSAVRDLLEREKAHHHPLKKGEGISF